MPWWPLWGAQRGRMRGGQDSESLSVLMGANSVAVETVPRPEVPVQRAPDGLARPITMKRIREALDRLEIRYLTDYITSH